MIYFFHGTDTDKVREKSHHLVETLRSKKPDASFSKIGAEHMSSDVLTEYSGGQGLFVSKSVVVLDRVCEKKETKELLLDHLKEISESDNIFIITEGKLDKATRVKIENKSEKTVLFDLKEPPPKKEYNAFALADAIGGKNKKDAWILYRRAVDSGDAPEALHGMIFWKIKTILISRSFFSWKEDEAKSFLDKLITIYHDSRRGGAELETALETLILSF